MASSVFPTVTTGVTVDTATNGALSGDGSSGNKLAVQVDGVTITINGSNELVAEAGIPTDVNSPADGQPLGYDAGSGKWINWNGVQLPTAVSGGGNFNPATVGWFQYDANGVEMLRIVATDPDTLNNFNSGNLYVGLKTGAGQPFDNSSAGFFNTGIGSGSPSGIYRPPFTAITTGNNNTVVGFGAGGAMTTVEYTAIIGAGQATALIDGDANTIVNGYDELSSLVHGSQNVVIGGTLTSDTTNAIALGYLATVSGSNRAVIGNGSVTDVFFGSETPAAIIHTNGVVFPITDPHVAGAWWDDSGVLTRSAG